MESSPIAVTELSDIAPVSNKEFLCIQEIAECRFTLNASVIRQKHSQLEPKDNYSQHSPVVWPVWLNGQVSVQELSGCGFESCCSYYFFFLFSKSLSFLNIVNVFVEFSFKNMFRFWILKYCMAKKLLVRQKPSIPASGKIQEFLQNILGTF